MSDATGANKDPSMDDILASIRKIISDDEARAQVAGQRVMGTSARATPVSPPAAARATSHDDVLLLTDLVEEPKTLDVRPTPIPVPRIDPVQAAEMPQPSLDALAEGSLLGRNATGSASSAFARLSQAVQDSLPPTNPGPMIGAGGKTLEDLVKEMLRPMLEDWLGKNLPPLVERAVEREIARLTRR
jgi:cell pole-organizing protein PopZ